MNENEAQGTDYPAGIVGLKSGELGRVGDLFRGGAPAVVLEDDTRIGAILSRMLDPAVALAAWNSSFLELARNHIAGDSHHGDMLRFTPEGIGHVARKILIVADDTGQARAEPATVQQGSQDVPSLPIEVVSPIWNLMAEIVDASTPAGDTFPPYAIEVASLAYPRVSRDFESIEALLRDSSRGGTRLGRRIDARHAGAAGAFSGKVLNRPYAVLSVVPGASRLLRSLNDRAKRRSPMHRVPVGDQIVGEPHFDGSKAITALATVRRSIRTEFFVDEGWHELPLSSSALTVFPSAWLSDRLGVTPTLHRVLLTSGAGSASDMTPDITLSIAVVSKER